MKCGETERGEDCLGEGEREENRENESDPKGGKRN